MAQTVATAGYDDDGNMTVYHLAPGEKLPHGVHPLPPKGTHPHERELAAQRAAEAPAEAQPEPVKRGPGRPPKLPRPGDD